MSTGKYINFGSANSHYFRRKDFPVKPDPSLWEIIEKDFGNIEKMFIGDQITDAKFISANPSVQGVLIPTKSADVTEIAKFILEHSEMVRRARIINRAEFPKLFRKTIFALKKKHKGKKPSLLVLTDADDTLHPKGAAQQYALKQVIQDLYSKNIYPVFTPGARDFIYEAVRRTGRLGNPDYYQDVRLVLALHCLFKYFRQNNRGPSEKEDIADGLVNSVLSDLGQDISALVSGFDLKEDSKFSRKLLVNPKIVAHNFREEEAKHTLRCIQNGKIFLYRQIYNTLMEYVESGDAIVRIVTRKPAEVFYRIADEPMQIK